MDLQPFFDGAADDKTNSPKKGTQSNSIFLMSQSPKSFRGEHTNNLQKSGSSNIVLGLTPNEAHLPRLAFKSYHVVNRSSMQK